MSIYKQAILVLALIALLGTVTNFVYFSPILTILLPLSIYVFNSDSLNRPLAWLYLYLTLFLVSTALYYPFSFIEFGFYRRDGNFLISYAPLLTLPLFNLKLNLERVIRYFLNFTVAIYVLVFLFYLGNNYYQSGFSFGLFGGLFYAQNAVGGFLSIVCALAFVFWYRYRSNKYLIILLFVFTLLVLTYSRGSIIGFLMAVPAWYFAIRKKFKWILVLLLFPVLLTIGSLMVGYPYYQNVMVSENMAEFDFEEGIETKNANILIRLFYTFPRAYYSFTHSPILGTGVGSFDDRPYHFKEIIPYVSYNAQPEKIHTDNHAHHSYLHILAEQGIVGLTVFLVFWFYLFYYLVQMPGNYLVRDFLLIAYFTITFAAFTEHRITTPSMMLPFTIPLALLMAQNNPVQTYKLEEVPLNDS